MFPGFYLFNRYISSYVLTSIAGIFTACPLAIHHYKKRGGDDISMIFVFLFGGVGCMVGMHLLYGITNIHLWGTLFSAASFGDWWDSAQLIFGGAVFYGGLIGGLIAGFLSIRFQKLDPSIVSDCAAPSVALFHMFGRIGCFLGGCCYGVEWEHGFTFTNSLIESANGVPRVPVQLFEAGLELVLFLMLTLLLVKGRLKGKLLSVYLLVYSVGRFVLEFWRGDDYRGFLFGLSTSQLISIALFVGTVVLLIVNAVKMHKPAVTTSEE